MAVLGIKSQYVLLAAAAAAVLIMSRNLKSQIIDKLAKFIPSVEGFQPTPYWDVSRYSWGYGTAAPGSTGTITRDQAFHDMLAYLLNDYATLSSRITRQLSAAQWTALLSFSYNLGVGNAYNLVDLINSGDDNSLGAKWNKYVYAGGSVSTELVNRRAKEWNLWNS